MALSHKLELRHSQSLVMTPQLMQAIKLLQLSNLDLIAYVDAELERNPLLERAEGADDGADDAPEEARDGGDDGAQAADDTWTAGSIKLRADCNCSGSTPSTCCKPPPYGRLKLGE